MSILACGAWLKNAACTLHGSDVRWSKPHGDLNDPQNCLALEESIAVLLAQAPDNISAVAHDLHPDFFSTRMALQIADKLGIPAIAVQHHHAHIGVLMAENNLTQEPVLGLALDGVGLGTDGSVWGGEMLLLNGSTWQRLGHLEHLLLPGGDIAAREPWRMAAAVLHACGRNHDIPLIHAPHVGQMAAQTVQAMLNKGINCPTTSSAGRWFDAAAGVLGISVRQEHEAQAAMMLEQMAAAYLTAHDDMDKESGEVSALTSLCIPAAQRTPASPKTRTMVTALNVENSMESLNLFPLFTRLLELASPLQPGAIAYGAALFHLVLAASLLEWLSNAARRHNVQIIALGGGCFLNRLLTTRLQHGLEQRGFTVLLPKTVSCGDSGIALGQAWVAQQHMNRFSNALSNVATE